MPQRGQPSALKRRKAAETSTTQAALSETNCFADKESLQKCQSCWRMHAGAHEPTQPRPAKGLQYSFQTCVNENGIVYMAVLHAVG